MHGIRFRRMQDGRDVIEEVNRSNDVGTGVQPQRPAGSKRQLGACMLLLLGMNFGWTGQASAETPSTEPPVQRLTKSYWSKFFLRYTPDGSRIAYSRQDANRRASNKVLVGLRLVKADGQDDRPLLEDFEKDVQIQEHAVFSRDGKRLYVSGGGNDTGNSAKDVFRADLDNAFQASGLRKVVAGTAVQLGEEPALAPDEKRIAFVTINEQLWVADADGRNKISVVQVSGSYCHQPDWSPDGEWIAFATDRDGNIEIYKVRPDGTELTRLTDAPGIDCRPRWSPDGEWILFTSNRNGNHDLYLMRHDGKELRPLTTHPATDDSGCWHPDGKSIAFVSMRDGGFDIYRIGVPADLNVAAAPRPRKKDPTASRLQQQDVVLRYDFESLTDGKVRDLAGRSHAELLGGAKIVTENGRSSVELDGKEAYLACGNAEAVRLAGPLTLSLWVRPAAFAGNGYLLSKHGWNIYVGADGRPRFETRSAADSAWDTLESSAAFKPGQWSQVVAVFDPQTKVVSIYVDGKKSGERARTDGAVGAVAGHPLNLGHYTPTRSQKFSGRIDEVRIMKHVMPAEEIASEFETQSRQVIP